ncbi:nuclear transport factor 2 family protein [Actinomadura sp. 6N118]|uniref:nuclear transport factor 2 family protein n=1 Tax=Actinomadura sp. 6N118 TaxID=3375151 RepID=UPI0037B2415E
MPSEEQIRAAVTRYLKAVSSGTADDIASCYAEMATLEDPVGSEPRRGRDSIRAFYSDIVTVRRHAELLTIRVAGSSAAFHFLVRTELPDQTVDISPIDVMTFDEEVQITSMRAFWGPADLRSTSATPSRQTTV